jgi:glucosyl-dolichyl phosphate glucuronosyltransferase
VTDAGTPFVSVVIPTHNRAEKLRVCLQSLVDQDYPADGFEIIVANDRSSDHTEAVVDSFAPRVTMTFPRGPGANAARNAGIAAARGDPICLVDDDVEAEPGWLAAYVDGFARRPDVHAFGGPVRLRMEGRTPRFCPEHPFVSSYDYGDHNLVLDVALGANMAVRRSTLDLVGRFDEWIEIGGADTEWFFRLERAGGQVVYRGGAGVWHRRTAEDLRVGRLIRDFFGRGVASHRFFIRTGSQGVWRNSARMVPRFLGAAFRERCRGAVAHAALQAGFAYGILRHRRLTPPVASPFELSDS